jgi:quinolinate synthase
MPFPSLLIHADSLRPQGSFAEAQATFLQPDKEAVEELDALLRRGRIGVVAHFYMDVELQSVLGSCSWEHIHVADSLMMADRAVQMAEAGVRSIVVLGVDFMSENVRAVLDAAGHRDLPVYRVAAREIGCSLADSAEALAYGAWLGRAAETPASLHVIYINTSLEVKAHSHGCIPTITCTSSNVLQTILQASSQIPGLSIWYGPDTYMGANLKEMLLQFATLGNDEIAAIHPAHSQESIRGLLDRFSYFPQGSCVVHHMFGAEVVEQVRREHGSAYHTAHLEVPGEMFALAAEAQREGRGVVGSTSNILDFIAARVEESAASSVPAQLSFVLGTEAGMITSIVRRVQSLLQRLGRLDIGVEIVFPVASEAIAQDDAFGIVPGVQGGEGCSTAGGCATCPYMKMNSLDALFDTVQAAADGRWGELAANEPRKYGKRVSGRTVADLGGEPILFMRHFQRRGELPPELVRMVQA